MPDDPDDHRRDAGAYRRHFPISAANRERARHHIARIRADLERRTATTDRAQPDTIGTDDDPTP